MLERIISGGQTGADQAGLAAAKFLNLKTGGWMPKNFRTDEGQRPDLAELYGMIEHRSFLYPPRTKLNISLSGFTLIFGNVNSRGCTLTHALCLSEGKNCFIVPWFSGNDIPSIEPFSDWLKIQTQTNNTLNVAGNRERLNPGIFEACKTFLIRAIKGGN